MPQPPRMMEPQQKENINGKVQDPVGHGSLDTALQHWLCDSAQNKTARNQGHRSQSFRDKGEYDLAYKDMPYFHILQVCLYLVLVALSMFLDDIGYIFQTTSAISVSSVLFLFPGFFYLMASNHEKKVKNAKAAVRAYTSGDLVDDLKKNDDSIGSSTVSYEFATP